MRCDRAVRHLRASTCVMIPYLRVVRENVAPRGCQSGPYRAPLHVVRLAPALLAVPAYLQLCHHRTRKYVAFSAGVHARLRLSSRSCLFHG